MSSRLKDSSSKILGNKSEKKVENLGTQRTPTNNYLYNMEFIKTTHTTN